MMQHELITGTGFTVVDLASNVMQVKGGTTVLSTGAQMLRNAGGKFHDELQYLAALQELVEKADKDPTPREDRTGTGTYSVFGRQWRFDLTEGFPLLTTKKLFTKGIIAELLWMLSGSTNIKPLVDQNVHIWNEWADENGELGPVYGEQWRRWEDANSYNELTPSEPIDQITTLIDRLKTKPNDRGHVVSAWNAGDLDDMALRPCHCLFQFYVEDGKLSCQLYQRSADIFLGVPFNIASYALLTHLIACEVGLGVGELVHTFGDLHLYANHVEQAKEQLTRTPRPFPRLFLNTLGWPGLFEVKPDRIQFVSYDPHPPIKAEVSI